MSHRVTDDDTTIDDLERLMRTPAFLRRARHVAAMIRQRTEDGDEWTFEEVADLLELPVEVVLLGFRHAVAMRLGMRIVPAAGVLQ
jgi:hypothetical protein